MAPPEPPNASSSTFSAWHAALWMLGSLIFIIVFVGIVHAFLPDIGRDLVSLGALSAMGFLGVAAFLLTRYPGGDRLSDAVGMRTTHLFAIPLALLIGVSLRGPAEALRAFTARHVDVSEQTQAALQEMTRVHSVTHAIFLFVVMALVVPLGEEVFFRGAVYGALRRGESGAFRATLITSLGFALSHPQALLPMGLVAFVLGFLRASSGSLWTALCAHVSFNAVEALEMSTHAVPPVDSALQWKATLLLAVLLTLFFLIVWRNPKARRSRDRESQAAFSSPPTPID